MTEENELKIPFQDLTRISIECKTCHAEIIIDIATERHRKIDWEEVGFACPACSSRPDSQVRTALKSFVNWYDCLIESKETVSLRIRIS